MPFIFLGLILKINFCYHKQLVSALHRTKKLENNVKNKKKLIFQENLMKNS